jgi:hypothetical protein
MTQLIHFYSCQDFGLNSKSLSWFPTYRGSDDAVRMGNMKPQVQKQVPSHAHLSFSMESSTTMSKSDMSSKSDMFSGDVAKVSSSGNIIR